MQTIDIPGKEFDFVSYSEDKRRLVEHKLDEYLALKEPVKLWESMRYSVLAGGKRLRALLCLAAAEAISENRFIEQVLPCCCALEIVHAMSLIHDDLPALDNDDYRRGRLTNHKVYGEAMALLAGDALLMLAIEILIEHSKEIDQSVLLEVVTGLSRAAGTSGMVGGQVLDLEYTGQTNQAIPIQAIETMHKENWCFGKVFHLVRSQISRSQ